MAEAIQALRARSMTLRAAVELAAYAEAKAPFIRSVIERARAKPAPTAGLR